MPPSDPERVVLVVPAGRKRYSQLVVAQRLSSQAPQWRNHLPNLYKTDVSVFKFTPQLVRVVANYVCDSRQGTASLVLVKK